MTGPFEKPTNIRFYSVPSLGAKEVKADERASGAILKGLQAIGFEAYRTPVSNGVYEITITKLPEG